MKNVFKTLFLFLLFPTLSFSFELIAHRGANALAPEMTKSAYLHALRFMPDYLEFDVQRTIDGRIILLHDLSLERTSDVESKIPRLKKLGYRAQFATLKEIKSLDAGSWFNPTYSKESILTLEEFLSLFQKYTKIKFYLEFKSPLLFPGIEKQTVSILKKYGALEKTTFQSFDPTSIMRVKKIAPENKATLLVSAFPAGNWKSTILAAKKIGADGVGPRADLFGIKPIQLPKAMIQWKHYIDTAHNDGLYVHPYVLNNAIQSKAFKLIGADGIFTDRIDLAKKLK